MTIECIIDEIPGASELSLWFGRFPSFDDANVEDFQIRGDGTGYLKVRTFRTTDKVDSKGYFVLEKRCLVTLRLEGVNAVELTEFMAGQAIIFDLEIEKSPDQFEVTVESSYGFGGVLRMGRISIEFEPEGTSTAY
jgi:hypothetical protein